MNNSERKWKEFEIDKLFELFNSKPYHKNELVIDDTNINTLPYISRTNKNNGLEDVVAFDDDYVTNPEDIIIFGAENATFFYQPFEHITGNKMYGIKHTKINKYVGLFIQQALNTSIEGCGFSFGQGLTGTRVKRRNLLLPVRAGDETEPDWEYMEDYIKNILQSKRDKYIDYIKSALKTLHYKDIPLLAEKDWKEFLLIDIFTSVQRGKRLIKRNQRYGDTPYISSTALNNGIDNYISNTVKVRGFSNCLTIANSGSVGASFYHPYEFVASDHVTHLKNDDFSMYEYLFISTMTNRFKKKYNFNREINDNRIAREKILLPINDSGEVDSEYMKQYMINLMIPKYEQYLAYQATI